MPRHEHPFCSSSLECLLLGLCAAVLVLASPFLALAIFATRPFVFVLVLLAILAVVSPFVLAPRLRGRWHADVAPESAYRGLRLARDVGVHPGHSWAWIGEDEVIVGADDLAQAELGPIEAIELPAQGRHVRQGEPLFTLRHGSRTLELPAPVSGTVILANDRLRERPTLINQRPFSLGWVARIRADESIVDSRGGLYFGHRAWRWFRSEVDRLLQSVPGAGAATGVDSTGVSAERLYTAIDDDTWRRLCVGGSPLAAG